MWGFNVVIKCFPSFSDIELFALFVSCLCHDLDHRGTNNQYQVASVSNCSVFSTVHRHCCLLMHGNVSQGPWYNMNCRSFPSPVLELYNFSYLSILLNIFTLIIEFLPLSFKTVFQNFLHDCKHLSEYLHEIKIYQYLQYI